MKLLVTGGAGFIGSHFIRSMLRKKDVTKIINLDKLTYAGHLENVEDCAKDRRYQFVKGDICDSSLVDKILKDCDAIINFAAESHVDRSIHDASPFIQTNIAGTQTLLDCAKRAKTLRFVQISTDEVYGSITKGFAEEDAQLCPSSPYSASKASADLLVLAYCRTFGFPGMITRAGNNYGPFQYPEKFLPLFITHAMEDQPLPLYGDGKQVREWLHVEDHCEGIEQVLRHGHAGEVYNIGTGDGHVNIEVARTLLNYLGKPHSLIQRVQDRPGHDRRYAMSIRKMAKQLKWQPRVHFRQGLPELIEWYRTNRPWWQAILHKSKTYKQFYTKQYSKGAA